MEAAFAVGARAALRGLGKRPELNGREGELVAWHEASGRWELALDGGGESIRARPENLELRESGLGKSTRSGPRAGAAGAAAPRAEEAQQGESAARRPLGPSAQYAVARKRAAVVREAPSQEAAMLSIRPEGDALTGAPWEVAGRRWLKLDEGWIFMDESSGDLLLPLDGAAEETEGPSAGKPSGSVRKGDVLYYRGRSCKVLTVSHETDPPHAVVRIDEDGREVGVETDHLSREEPRRGPPRVLCLSSTTAGPRAIERQLAGLRKAAEGRVELVLAEGWNEPSWDWRQLDEADWATFREALDWLQALLRERAPVDAVLGLSQGADFAAMLAAQALLGVGVQLQGVCLLGPHLPRYIGHFPELFAEDEPLRLPALVVADAREGKVDASRHPEMDGCNLPSEYVANMFQDAQMASRPVLLLENAAQAEAAAAHEVDGSAEEVIAFVLQLGRAPAKGPSVSVGDRVKLSGLVSAPDLNGKAGIVERWDFACGRWAVRVDGCAEPLFARTEKLEPQPPLGCFKCGAAGKEAKMRKGSPFCAACWACFCCALCKRELGKWEDSEGQLHCSRCLWDGRCSKCREPAGAKDEHGTAFCKSCWARLRCVACERREGSRQDGKGGLVCDDCWRRRTCTKCKNMMGSEKDEAGNLYCSACWARHKCALCGAAIGTTKNDEGKPCCSRCQTRCSTCGRADGVERDEEGRLRCSECLKSCRCVKCGKLSGETRDDDSGVHCAACWGLRFCAACGDLADESKEDAGMRYCSDCWAARICIHCGGLARGHMDEKGSPCCSKCWSQRQCSLCKKHVGSSRDEAGALYCAQCWASRFCKECKRPACGKRDHAGDAYCARCWEGYRQIMARWLEEAQSTVFRELLRSAEGLAAPALATSAAGAGPLRADERRFLLQFGLGPQEGALPEPAPIGGFDFTSGPWLQTSRAQGVALLSGFEFASEFDGGNALPESWSLERKKDDSIPTFSMRIAHDCHHLSNSRSRTFWFNFGVTPVEPEAVKRHPCIRLAVRGMSRQENLFEESYAPVMWTPSRPSWRRVDTELEYHQESSAYSEEKQGATWVLSWTHTFGPGDAGGATYFAFCYPFSFTELQHCLARLEATLAMQRLGRRAELGCLHGPHAACACAYGERCSGGEEAGEEPELPAVGAGVYFHRQLLARTPQGRCVEVLTVTQAPPAGEPDEPDELPDAFPFHGLGGWPSSPPRRFQGRPVIFASARVHPGESPGQFAALGLLRFMLSDDPRAALLRSQYVLKLVPMLNPDGVAWGHSRVSSRGHDLNRCYQDPKPEEHEGIAAVKALIRCWSERRELAVYVDCHAHAGVKGCFLYGNLREENFLANVAYAHLAQLNCPHLDIDMCLWSSAPKQESGRAEVGSTFGLVNAYTLECNYNSGRLARAVPDAPGLGRAAAWTQEIRGPRMGTSRFAPVPYDPCAWGAVGEALAVAVLDLQSVNPHSRLLVGKPPKLVSANSSEKGHGTDILGALQHIWQELTKRHQGTADT